MARTHYVHVVTVRETGEERVLEPVGVEENTKDWLVRPVACGAMPKRRRLYSRYSLDPFLILTGGPN